MTQQSVRLGAPGFNAMQTRTLATWWLMLVLGTLLLSVPPAAAYSIREAGMGGSHVALADEVGAIWVNPAGLAIAPHQARFLYQADPDAGASGYFVGYVEPDVGFGAGGISLTLRNDPIGTDPQTGKALYRSRQTWAYTVGKRSLAGISLGVNLRYETLFNEITRVGGRAYRLDFGAKQVLFPWLAIGVAWHDAAGTSTVWANGDTEALQRRVQTGVVVRPFRGTTVAVDTENAQGLSPVRRLGLEQQMRQGYVVRFGTVTNEATTQYNLGFSLQRGLWVLDYALSGISDAFTGRHSVAVTLNF